MIRANRPVRLALVVSLLVPELAGCVGSYGDAQVAGMTDRGKVSARPTPSEYCQSLDSSRDTWGGLAKGLALVSAGVAASVVAWKDENAQRYSGIGAAAGAGVAGGMFWFSEAKGKQWARDCSEP